MLLILGLVFVGVFVVIALPMIAVGHDASRQAEKAVSALDSALANSGLSGHLQLGDFRKNEALSSIPWLDKLLNRFEMAPRIGSLLSQAGLTWTAGALIAGCGTAFAIAGYLIYLRSDSVALALCLGAIAGASPFGWVLFKRGKRFNLFLQGLPEALDLMVSAVRAGHSLIAAMGLVGRECADPVGVEFRACFEEQNYGLEMKAAMENMIARVPIQELRIVATAIMIQKESGGNLAEVLDKTAHVIRERFRLKRQVNVHTAQGRMTGWILTALPIGLGIVLYIANPSMMSILWTNPIGIKLLWTSAVMMVLGGLIIRKIVRVDV
jgi:tight adherence protein B